MTPSPQNLLCQEQIAVIHFVHNYFKMPDVGLRSVETGLLIPVASSTCRPPPLVLAYVTRFSHVVGLQRMHELC